MFLGSINLFINIWNKEQLPQQWNESIIIPLYKKVIKQAVVIIDESHLSTTYVDKIVEDHQNGP
jgi:hypothetical protein